jgi:hypothetical protein
VPITLHEGKILDGRNRHRACEIAGVFPAFVEYIGADPLGFVVSHNLHRRHLTESQRGMVAAKLANLEDGQRADRVAGSIDAPRPLDRTAAAEMLNVGESTVTRARSFRTTRRAELKSPQA